VASAVTASAQGLIPAIWQGQRGSLLKVLTIDPAGNFSGAFLSSRWAHYDPRTLDASYDVVGDGRTEAPSGRFRFAPKSPQVSGAWSGCRLNRAGSRSEA